MQKRGERKWGNKHCSTTGFSAVLDLCTPKREITAVPLWDWQVITWLFSVPLCSSLAWRGGQDTEKHPLLTWRITRVKQHRSTQPTERVTWSKVQIQEVRRRQVGWLAVNKHARVHVSAQPRAHASSSKAHERPSAALTRVGACTYKYTSYKDVTNESVAVLDPPTYFSIISLHVTILWMVQKRCHSWKTKKTPHSVKCSSSLEQAVYPGKLPQCSSAQVTVLFQHFMSGYLTVCWTCKAGVNGHLQTSLERVKLRAAGTWLLHPLTLGICAMTLHLSVCLTKMVSRSSIALLQA